MFKKTALLTIFVVGVWFIFNLYSQPVSSNTSEEKISLSSEKDLKPDSSKKILNYLPVTEPDYENKDYIVDCSSERTISDKEVVEHDKSAQDYFRTLSNSNLKDKQLEYTIFAEPPDGETRLDLLNKFNERFPNNSIVLHEIIRVCVNSSDKTQCNSNLIEAAIASDKNNGAIWLQSIIFNAIKENDNGIVYSIQELVKSSFYNDGFVERIKLYSKSLEYSPANNTYLNLIRVFGNEMDNLPNYSSIRQWCKKNKNDTIRADACLQLGNYMEKSSKRLIAQMIGRELKKIIFEAQGALKLFEKAENEHRKVMAFLRSEKFKRASSLLKTDKRLLMSWLNHAKNYGETVAFKFLVEEAITLSKNEEYSPCRG